MSDQTSIFQEQSPSATPTQTNTNGGAPASAPSQDELTTLLSSIKNERGEQKYLSMTDALKALSHSQNYIPELASKLKQQEQELQEAREAAAKVAELERVVKSLTEAKTQTETPVNQVVSPDQVSELVAKALSEKEAAQTYRTNLQKVVSAVRQVYGDKADEVFYGRASELDMTKEEINALAATKPMAVFKLLGITDSTTVTTGAPTTSSINTTGLEPKNQTYVARNTKPVQVGATYHELSEEIRNARKMVDELHSQGKSVNNLTTYSEYVKYFKK